MGVALPPLLRSVTVRHLRLASGQVMWLYICAHFLNHSLGLLSLGAAEAALKLAAAVWQSLPGTMLLYGAFATHVSPRSTGCISATPCGCRRSNSPASCSG